MSAEPLELVRQRLEEHGSNPGGGQSFMARCVAHVDRTASLHVSLGDDGRVLLHCFAGCPTFEILDRLSLAWRDLYPDDSAGNGRGDEIAVYRYVDEQGAPLFEVGRFEPKTFLQRRPCRTDWKGGIGGVRRVLYRLPRVLAAIQAAQTVYVVEGEKDVHSLEAKGVVATTCPGGAGKWRPEYNAVFKGATVAIIRDIDEPDKRGRPSGQEHAQHVYEQLTRAAASVRMLEPATGKDVSDHLAAGRGLDEFVPVEGEQKASPPPLVIRASDVKSRSIRWAWEGRMAIGYLTVQTGIEGIGKSVFDAWAISRWTRGELPGEWRGQPIDALIVADEDGREDTWKPRLDLAKADASRIGFLNPDALSADWNVCDGIEQLRAAIEQTTGRVLFIDAVLDHMPPPRGGETINSPTFVRDALRPLKRLARELDLVGLYSMHPPKGPSASFRDLVQASQAFSAVPRVGLLFAWHPDDSEEEDVNRRRVLIRGKGNLGRDPGALEFRVSEVTYRHDDGRVTGRELVTDIAPSAVTLADLDPQKRAGGRLSKSEQAAELIRAALADRRWHEAEEVLTGLAHAGFTSGSVLTPARRLVGVETRKRPGVTHGPWEWRLSAAATESSRSAPDDGILESSPAARARPLPDGRILDFGGGKPSGGGKNPRFPLFEGSEGLSQDSPPAGSTRAPARGEPGDLAEAAVRKHLRDDGGER